MGMTVVLKGLKDNTAARTLSNNSLRALSLISINPDVSEGQNRCTLHSLNLSFSHKNLHIFRSKTNEKANYGLI